MLVIPIYLAGLSGAAGLYFPHRAFVIGMLTMTVIAYVTIFLLRSTVTASLNSIMSGNPAALNLEATELYIVEDTGFGALGLLGGVFLLMPLIASLVGMFCVSDLNTLIYTHTPVFLSIFSLCLNSKLYVYIIVGMLLSRTSRLYPYWHTCP